MLAFHQLTLAPLLPSTLELWCIHAQDCGVCICVVLISALCTWQFFVALTLVVSLQRRSFSVQLSKTSEGLRMSEYEGKTGWSRLCLWKETLYPLATFASHSTSCPPASLHIQSCPVPAVKTYTYTPTHLYTTPSSRRGGSVIHNQLSHFS